MKEKTKKRLEKKLKNLPRYFLDSSIFLEIIFEQEKAPKCKGFLNQSGFKYRFETSSLVLGEVVKGITSINEQEIRGKALLWLDYALQSRKIVIQTPSRKCLGLALEIMAYDTRVGSVDALIFGDCVDNGCKDFLTKDSGFSKLLGKKYGVRIHAA